MNLFQTWRDTSDALEVHMALVGELDMADIYLYSDNGVIVNVNF